MSQGINGNIEYDTDQGTINGNIEFPGLNFSSKPSLGGGSAAMKPILVAALKAAPLKLGSVGWKLIKLLAWKKIYKTHHPKSGEIIIEQQEVKHAGGHHSAPGSTSSLSELKSAKLEMLKHLKTAKMGLSGGGEDPGESLGGAHWPQGGSAAAGDFSGASMSAGGKAELLGSSALGAPFDSLAAASMLHQRNMLPPAGLSGSIGPSPTAGGQAAAAAAAAAATAAAIQSHWLQLAEQQQQEHDSQQQVAATNASSPANALRRKKATPPGSNWFASASPQAQAYAAAAAAAAAAMAHQQQQQLHTNRLRLYLMQQQADSNGGQAGHQYSWPFASSGANLMFHHHHNLFDNAASMAVQNAVKLSPAPPHNIAEPQALADYFDQSDQSLISSAFSSPLSSPTSSSQGYQDIGSAQSQTQNLVDWPAFALSTKRQDSMWPVIATRQANSGGINKFTSGFNESSTVNLDSIPEFDETPAARMLGAALSEQQMSANRFQPIYRMLDSEENHRRVGARYR